MALLKREDVSSDLKALLGPGTEFEGKISFEGAIRIDGRFSGSITKGDMLIVGETAVIVAEITCGSVVICGEVTGNIHARSSVELRQQARVRGDIETPSLMIERGALFEGSMRMESARAELASGAGPAPDLPAAGAALSTPPPLVAVNG